jgi:hypothetical protein
LMVFIDTDLNRAMLRLVHRPSRYRRNHAKREPAKCEQVQQRADTVIDRNVIRRYRKNGQSGKWQGNRLRQISPLLDRNGTASTVNGF